MNGGNKSSQIFDEKYFKLINEIKPDTKYYQQGLGDKLLFL